MCVCVYLATYLPTYPTYLPPYLSLYFIQAQQHSAVLLVMLPAIAGTRHPGTRLLCTPAKPMVVGQVAPLPNALPSHVGPSPPAWPFLDSQTLPHPGPARTTALIMAMFALSPVVLAMTQASISPRRLLAPLMAPGSAR